MALGGGAAIVAAMALPAAPAAPLAAMPLAARNEVPLPSDLQARTGIGSVSLDQEGNGALFDARHQPRGSFSTSVVSDNHVTLTVSPAGARPSTCDLTVTTAGDQLTLNGTLNGQRILLVASRASRGLVGKPVVPAVDAATSNAAQAISQALQAQNQQHKRECLLHLIVCGMALMHGDYVGAGQALINYANCELAG
jgi:hypothetical protein